MKHLIIEIHVQITTAELAPFPSDIYIIVSNYLRFSTSYVIKIWRLRTVILEWNAINS